jgi:2-haloacid dehalogenase
MSEIRAVVFDLGGVLVDWNPRYVFHDQYFKSEEERQYFFEKVCTAEWNENQDAGYSIEKATEEKIAEFPSWEKAIRDYYGKWKHMLKDEIANTVKIFKALRKNSRIKLYALTNWSAETFPVALNKFDFLHEFDGILVSGTEKTRKPFPAFYKILLDRYNLKPEETLFIDDSRRNVLAAKELGINTIHFNSPEELEEELKNIKLI